MTNFQSWFMQIVIVDTVNNQQVSSLQHRIGSSKVCTGISLAGIDVDKTLGGLPVFAESQSAKKLCDYM